MCRFLDVFVARHADLFELAEIFGDSLKSAAHHSGGCRMVAGPADANAGLAIAALALECADAIHAARLGPRIV